MKKKFSIKHISLGLAFLLAACQDNFLDQPPIGQIDQGLLNNEAGALAILVGAYSLLDGQGAGGSWDASGANWVYGGICGSDAYKGAAATEQPEITSIERFESLPTSSYFRNKWRTVYDGVGRANDAIRAIKTAEDISEANEVTFTAEARFLRGHYHFEAKKMWNNVPYIDENVTDYRLPNNQNIWPQIEADFKFAYDNLPEDQLQVGRANKWAAAAYLAKTYMFQGKFADAKPLLEKIITDGKNANKLKYQLVNRFHDNFRAATKNNLESVFEIQYSVNDGANGGNGGAGEVLNFPNFGRAGDCCGLYQPSQNLVNAFKTDTLGLPLLDSFNKEDVKNDEGLQSSQTFVPYTGNLDPRLDWTTGRRGIPYLDWGNHPGRSWIFDQNYSGPYSPKKNVFYKAEEGINTQASSFLKGYVANNYRMIRFADVLLWAAECEVEIGSLDKARDYVNQIRKRAANTDGFVKGTDGKASAKYVIGLYEKPWTDKEMARTAVRFERRLELAMEGHRFFDLVRWGIADSEINAYLEQEQKKRQYLKGAIFKKGKSEYFPIPQASIDLSSKGGLPTLKQNPGY